MKANLYKVSLALAPVLALTLAGAGPSDVRAAAYPSDDKTILHVLNRIGFGARPGDVERVRATGLQKYIDQQLHPERIADSAMAAHLAGLNTLTLSSSEIMEQYEKPTREAQQAKKREAASAGENNEDANKPQLPPELQQKANRLVADLAAQKVLRATYSDRQLQEVLVDFWFNHFNVDARKGRDRFLLTEYDRDVIRPHVLGKFRDLLEATAKSPAMLFYLDNWLSADPNGPHLPEQRARVVRGPFGGAYIVPPAQRPQAQNQNNPRKGLNENYGRELMELHTLGVDGGYTQKDVTEVARAFTGWTIENPRQSASFKFEARIHDPGPKVVLGHVIKAGGGQSDGEEVLDILARHPSTARFISTKLVRRFVSDTPPASLVDRAAARFTETGGDIREVMRTILTSKEFLAPEAYRAKVKAPFEFVVSAVRAMNADVEQAMPLVRTMQQLGEPLYQCQPPTGYKDTGDAWVNTGALVNRMNFALQLSSGKVPGVFVDAQQDTDGEMLIAQMLAGDVSDSTRATIGKATTPVQMAALTLGSPEFQRR